MYNIKYFKKINSTNIFAKENLEKLTHFDVISADLQDKGHGQFNRYWYSTDKNGGNCYITIVLKPENPQNLEKLTQYASLKVGETFEKYGLKVEYKYPNDVLIDGKKISGILAKSVFCGESFRGVFVGIGANLNLNSEDLKEIDIPATSIFNETGKNVNKTEFIEYLLDNFYENFEDFISNKTEEDILCYHYPRK
jgi:BirA family biotin operon repressor/biotin-[acetyl-CoA-carboxylase] ligase